MFKEYKEFIHFDLETAKLLIEQHGLLASSFIINTKKPELNLTLFLESLEYNCHYTHEKSLLYNSLDTVEYFLPKIEEDLNYLKITDKRYLDILDGLRECKIKLLSTLNHNYTRGFNPNEIPIEYEKYLKCYEIDEKEFDVIANPPEEFLEHKEVLNNLITLTTHSYSRYLQCV